MGAVSKSMLVQGVPTVVMRNNTNPLLGKQLASKMQRGEGKAATRPSPASPPSLLPLAHLALQPTLVHSSSKRHSTWQKMLPKLYHPLSLFTEAATNYRPLAHHQNPQGGRGRGPVPKTRS